MKDESHPKWEKLSAALRDAGVARRPDREDLSAPPGLATRVVSRFQADQRADAAGLVLWRRWSMAGAAAAILLFGGTFLVKPPPEPLKPIIPVPALETELPKLAER